MSVTPQFKNTTDYSTFYGLKKKVSMKMDIEMEATGGYPGSD